VETLCYRSRARIGKKQHVISARFIAAAWGAAALAAIPQAVAQAVPAGPRVTWVAKKDFVVLKDLARAYSMSYSGPAGKKITLQNRYNVLAFQTDSRELVLNNTRVWLHEPVQPANGQWAIRGVDWRKSIDPILNPDPYLKTSGYRLVVLDPGHGGEDAGALGARGLEEKRVVLDIARRVRIQLANAGVRVYLTRQDDRFVELEERTRKAKSWGADVFVSIHLNSAADDEASGTETYVLTSSGFYSTAGGQLEGYDAGSKFEGANVILGHQIQKAVMGRVVGVDRGVRRSRFLVLRQAPCPAALVECCFVSNRLEVQKILTEEYRDQLAAGLARGIVNYLNEVKRARLTAEAAM
jgi:N-acetylmuramoyl-L-alanine amidase